MTRPVLDLPEVEISSTFLYDPTDVTTGDYIMISARYKECAAGEIVLDRPEDLIVLRTAIDTYISKHKINTSNSTDHEQIQD